MKIFENGNWNFYIRQGKTCNGESLNFYEVSLGDKFVGTYNTIKGCKIAIKKGFGNMCGENINIIII